MSSVEFQAGIEGISARKGSIEVRLVLPSESVADSALGAWLIGAQRTGVLHTVAISATEVDEYVHAQLRLFEDLMIEHTPLPVAREAVPAVAQITKRNGRPRRESAGVNVRVVSGPDEASARAPTAPDPEFD
ncbi:MAG TPA: hypothetical protein VNI83_02285 [Vicinamibacterales bacterium]|nr:hypothetical protein [Vicinamibacterales bacterium]